MSVKPKIKCIFVHQFMDGGGAFNTDTHVRTLNKI